jgi:hypothetical protein
MLMLSTIARAIAVRAHSQGLQPLIDNRAGRLGRFCRSQQPHDVLPLRPTQLLKRANHRVQSCIGHRIPRTLDLRHRAVGPVLTGLAHIVSLSWMSELQTVLGDSLWSSPGGHERLLPGRAVPARKASPSGSFGAVRLSPQGRDYQLTNHGSCRLASSPAGSSPCPTDGRFQVARHSPARRANGRRQPPDLSGRAHSRNAASGPQAESRHHLPKRASQQNQAWCAAPKAAPRCARPVLSSAALDHRWTNRR